MERKLKAAVQMVSELIVEKNYTALSDLTENGPRKLSAEDFRMTIEDYPAVLRMPTAAEMSFDAIEIEDSSPPQYSVDAPLFTIEEGRSDLKFRMTVIDGGADAFAIVLYDVWVM